MDLTPIKNLDKVLKTYYENKDKLGLQAQHIAKPSGVLDDEEIQRIIDKLFKDGFIAHALKENFKSYLITYDGVIWYLSEGYEGDLKRKNAQSIQVETLAFSQHELADRLNSLTLWAVRGTWGIAVGAVALVLWEIYKTFYIEHSR